METYFLARKVLKCDISGYQLSSIIMISRNCKMQSVSSKWVSLFFPLHPSNEMMSSHTCTSDESTWQEWQQFFSTCNLNYVTMVPFWVPLNDIQTRIEIYKNSIHFNKVVIFIAVREGEYRFNTKKTKHQLVYPL